MTCPKCGYQWCWLCGAKFKEDHFNKWNLFGCPALQFVHQMSKCRQINMVLLTILMIPLILLFRPVVIIFKMMDNPLYAPNGWRWCCPFKRWVEECFPNSCWGKCWIVYVTYVIIVPCLFVLGLLIGCVNIIVFGLPALMF